MLTKHNKTPEYDLYGAIAKYMRLQYPKVVYHFDPTGLNLSKTQRGKLKVIQSDWAWPDLFIAKQDNREGSGMFIEVKPIGTRIYNRYGQPANEHIQEQFNCIERLRECGYWAELLCGFDEIKEAIDLYLK